MRQPVLPRALPPEQEQAYAAAAWAFVSALGALFFWDAQRALRRVGIGAPGAAKDRPPPEPKRLLRRS